MTSSVCRRSHDRRDRWRASSLADRITSAKRGPEHRFVSLWQTEVSDGTPACALQRTLKLRAPAALRNTSLIGDPQSTVGVCREFLVGLHASVPMRRGLPGWRALSRCRQDRLGLRHAVTVISTNDARLEKDGSLFAPLLTSEFVGVTVCRARRTGRCKLTSGNLVGEGFSRAHRGVSCGWALRETGCSDWLEGRPDVADLVVPT